MRETYGVYCDESCHLEKDRQKVMALGALWCPFEKRREITARLREIKAKHGLKSDFEVKWTKISPAKLSFYLEYIDYFFDDDDAHFRALVVSDKSKLRHAEFCQDHDQFYYKMYFDLLKVVLTPKEKYRVFLDIKDTRGGEKTQKLHDVLCNNLYDFSRSIIQSIQLTHSREVELLQLADILTGSISAAARGTPTSEAKQEVLARIRKRSGYNLRATTLLRESKFNLFYWSPREGV